MTTSVLTYDREAGKLAPDPRTLFELRLAPLGAAFLFLTAAAHWSLATFGRRWYQGELRRGDEPGALARILTQLRP